MFGRRDGNSNQNISCLRVVCQIHWYIILMRMIGCNERIDVKRFVLVGLVLDSKSIRSMCSYHVVQQDGRHCFRLSGLSACTYKQCVNKEGGVDGMIVCHGESCASAIAPRRDQRGG
jgi:hypothetical protein